MFVCLGSALFTVLSYELSKLWGDENFTRIAAEIIPGIGFLGAGAILRDRAGYGGLTGMTTAATIFVEAAIGMACGGGLFKVGATATGLVLFALVFLFWGENVLNLKSCIMAFRFTTSHADNVATEIQQLLAGLKITMSHFRVSLSGTQSIVEFEADVSPSQQQKIVSQLNRQGVVTEVVPCESPHE
jgi:putative Mg2+ transporter-C (MgtC) family protein